MLKNEIIILVLRKSPSLFICFLLSLNIVGQESKPKDSITLVSYADKVIIKTNISTESDTYILRGANDNIDLEVISNNNYRLFLSLDYQFIGISIGFDPSFFPSNRDDYLKGESNYSDFQFHFFLGKWIQTIKYKKIKGYYIENTHDFVSNWVKGEDPYIQIPSLKNTSWGMSTSYVFNPKFSARNIIYQTEWQKQSAGSLVPTLFYNYNQISFDFEGTNSKNDIFDISLSLAYYYTFVINENWFIAPNLSPSLGIKFDKNRSITNSIKDSDNSTYFNRLIEGGLQVGYSSNKLIFGGSFNFRSSRYNSNNNTITENNQIFGKVYLGYRFDTPKFIENSFNWLTKTIENK